MKLYLLLLRYVDGHLCKVHVRHNAMLYIYSTLITEHIHVAFL